MRKTVLILSLAIIATFIAQQLMLPTAAGEAVVNNQHSAIDTENLLTQPDDENENSRNCILYPDGAGPAIGSGGGGVGDGSTAHGELTWASATSELVALGATRGVSVLGNAPTVALVIVDDFASTQKFPYYELWAVGAPTQTLLMMGVDIEEFSTAEASARIGEAIAALGAQGVEDVVVNMSWLILPCDVAGELNILTYLDRICQAEGDERAQLSALLGSIAESLTFEQLCAISSDLQDDDSSGDGSGGDGSGGDGNGGDGNGGDSAQAPSGQLVDDPSELFTVRSLNGDALFTATGSDPLAAALTANLQQTQGERFAELLARFYDYLNQLIEREQLSEEQLPELLPEITPFLTPPALDEIMRVCQEIGELSIEELPPNARLLVERLRNNEALDEGLLCEIMGAELPTTEPIIIAPVPVITPTPDPRAPAEQLRDALREGTAFQIEEAELRQIEAVLARGAIRDLYLSTEQIDSALRTGDFFNDDPLSNLITTSSPAPVSPLTTPTPGNGSESAEASEPRVMFIAAAGNSGLLFPFVPALLDNVISVSTVDGRRYTSNSGEIVMPGWHPNGIDEGSSFAAPRLSAWTAVHLLMGDTSITRRDENICQAIRASGTANPGEVTSRILSAFSYLNEQGQVEPAQATGSGTLPPPPFSWEERMSCPKDMPNLSTRAWCKDISLKTALRVACELP